MTDSTNQMLKALESHKKKQALEAVEPDVDSPVSDLNKSHQPDMANLLKNCFTPDFAEPNPNK